ncbi:MAG: hypothetical protein JW882_20545 [Deltaproteobacteria bacterium]|nr:hypothetical protein [Deltaproteobacteria bacterium]
MGFTFRQECPQCGAPIDLDETDHLLRCPYCEVNNFLYTTNYFRFVLPDKAAGRDIIYAPYLRFKGNVYFCQGTTIGHRIVDITNVGLDFKSIPLSLGLRPQAMKMKFVTPETKGSYLKFTFKAAEILNRAGKIPSGSASSHDRILHRAYIGETMSLIYLPMYIQNNRLYDAVINRPFPGPSDAGETIESYTVKNPGWKIQFIATICPQCGWNLEGESDSVVLTCSNCDTAWEAVNSKFEQVRVSFAPDEKGDCVYLPFWRNSASTKGVDINSFGDFLRITNQPVVITEDYENEDMSFWSPAFKIRPKIFLNTSKQFTVSQRDFKLEEKPPGGRAYPVTLPRTEAIQAMKITLAASAVTKKNIFPYLPQISYKIKSSGLVYLPFRDTGHEMTQSHTGICINKNSLNFGRKL